MNSIYEDGTYLANHPTWHEEDAAWKAKNIHKMIQKSNLHIKTLCEIGCGTGRILLELARLYGDDVKLHGFDVSSEAIGRCEKNMPNISCYHGDGLAIDNRNYDLVLVIDVMEHIEDYFAFLRRVHEKGRHFIFHVPLDLSVQTVIRRSALLKRKNTSGHLHYFTKELALDALRSCGYAVQDVFYTRGSLELPGRSRKAKCLALPRRMSFAINQDIAVKVFGGYSLMILAK